MILLQVFCTVVTGWLWEVLLLPSLRKTLLLLLVLLPRNLNVWTTTLVLLPFMVLQTANIGRFLTTRVQRPQAREEAQLPGSLTQME